MVSVSLTPRCVRDCFFFYKFYELFSLNSTFINYHQVHSCPWQESRNQVVDDHAMALSFNLDWSHQFRHFRNFDDHQLDQHIREDLNWKKNVFFRALPELPNPPPPWPQFGQLGPLFSEVEIQDLKVSLELKILYMLYDILYICNLKNS